MLHGDEDLISLVNKCIEYEDTVISRLKIGGRVDIVREKYLAVGDDKVGQWVGVTGGYPDTLIMRGSEGVILDWKFGKVPVSPTKDNLQGIAYAAGAFYAYPELKTVEVHFFHPRQGWSSADQERLYVHTFHRHELPALELRIRVVITRKHAAQLAAKNGDWSQATPKHDLCVFCAKHAECPKVNALIVSGVSKYENLTVPSELVEYRLDSPTRVAQAHRFASQLKTICESVLKRCTDAAVTEGLKPDGYTIVKSARRQVLSVRKFVELALDYGLNENEAVELLSVPIGEFETLIKSRAAKGQGAAKLRAFKQALAETGVTQVGKPFYFLRAAKSPAEQADSVLEIESN